MSTDALSIRALRRSYGDVHAVAGVDLDVAEGERFALLGPSGSGKTTMLRLIAGFEAPDGGSIELRGQDVAATPPERRNVGVVFQDYALFEHRSVSGNIEFGLRMRGMGKEQRAARVAELLALVDLEPEKDRRPTQLSGGQRQRVALARALAPSPDLLLLDEPLANLDRRLRESLREELVRITDAVGITSVLVTHDQEEALTFADRVGVLDRGKLVQVGAPAEVWRAPLTPFVATFLGDMNLLMIDPHGDGWCGVDGIDGSVRWMGAAPGSGSGSIAACFRPEALQPVADADGPGVVTSIVTAGGAVTVGVELGGSRSITCAVTAPSGEVDLTVGDRVRVVPLVDTVHLLDVGAPSAASS